MHTEQNEQNKVWFYKTFVSADGGADGNIQQKVISSMTPSHPTFAQTGNTTAFCSVSRDSPVGLHGPNAVEQGLLQQTKVDAGIHGAVQDLQLVDVDVRKPFRVAAYNRLAHGQNLFPLCY